MRGELFEVPLMARIDREFLTSAATWAIERIPDHHDHRFACAKSKNAVSNLTIHGRNEVPTTYRMKTLKAIGSNIALRKFVVHLSSAAFNTERNKSSLPRGILSPWPHRSQEPS